MSTGAILVEMFAVTSVVVPMLLDQKRKFGLVKRIKKQIDKFGLTNEELGITSS